MDEQRFDWLTRTFTTGAPSRRIAVRLAAGSAFAALLSRFVPDEAAAKNKKKRCKKAKQPGQKCKKKNSKKCKCSGGAKCQGKRCTCPEGQTVCNGACGIACGDGCCEADRECLSNGSCAVPCMAAADCPSDCGCVTGGVCSTMVSTFCPSGTEQQCESTADCPAGSACLLCDSGAPVGIDFFCVALCGS